MKHNIVQEETGREGEILTLEYEEKRTGKKAYWESFETNLVGYDIISILNSSCLDNLLIEVKSSKRGMDYAEMIISRNEWETACRKIRGSSYVFYLWLLAESNKLCKLMPEDIAPHIPVEDGWGRWEQVSIPFRIFKDSFSVI